MTRRFYQQFAPSRNSRSLRAWQFHEQANPRGRVGGRSDSTLLLRNVGKLVETRGGNTSIRGIDSVD